jgi:hypothetical protein
MKQQFLLLALTVAVLSSCTTAYKTGQTPDDVYFSKGRHPEEYVRVEEDNDRQYRYNEEYVDDRYLRMKVRNRSRWSDLDDWYFNERNYRYNVFSSGCFGYDPWTPYSYWNSYYNPYYRPYYHNYSYVSIKTASYQKPRTFNLNTYTSSQNNNIKTYGNSKYTPVRSGNNNSYTPSPSGSSNSGSTLRNIFNGNNSSSGNKINTNTSSGSNNNSGSSGNSGGNAPVRRF